MSVGMHVALAIMELILYIMYGAVLNIHNPYIKEVPS